MSGNESHDNEEFNEFLFGPRDREDGTTPVGPEERRRQAALKYHAERLAKKHGIEIEDAFLRPIESTVPTNRAHDIKEIADQLMPEADRGAKTRMDYASAELSDGTKIKRFRFDMAFLDNLSDAVKDLATIEWPGKLASKGLRLSLRIGRFVSFKAEVSQSTEAKASKEATVGVPDPRTKYDRDNPGPHYTGKPFSSKGIKP
ncbi:MAG: hypothetical protein KC996_09770 [Phycisphaerales bacterium]|nr:hypothetical protein [Phycisphaerales bacterium]